MLHELDFRPKRVKLRVTIIVFIYKHFQVKSLRDRKTADTEAGQRQKLQNNRKADRFVQEIHALKKAKKRDIALFVLQNTDYWLPELPRDLVNNSTNSNECKENEKSEKELHDSLGKRALIRMSNHGEVKKLVSKFREDYPSWQGNLPRLLTVLGKKQRQKDDKSKIKRRREERERRKEKNKDRSLKNSEPIGEQKSSSLDADENDMQESDIISDDEDSINQNDDFDESEEMESEAEDSDTTINENSSDAINITSSTTVNISGNENQEESNETVQCSNNSTKSVEKQEGDMIITRLNVNEPNNELFAENKIDLNKKGESMNQSKVVKDSFFLGGVSDSASENEEESIDIKDKNELRTQTKQNYFVFGQKEANKSNGYRNNGVRSGKGQPMNRDWSSRDHKTVNNIRGNYRFEKRNKHGREQSEMHSYTAGTKPNTYTSAASNHQNNSRNIHPSWAAKRKIADSAHININLKGNKIKFDDNGKQEVKNYHKNEHTIQIKHSEDLHKPSNLHPSWAAKKEQKGIQQFSGKKTVFGEDD